MPAPVTAIKNLLLVSLSFPVAVTGRQYQALPRSTQGVTFYRQPWSPSSQVDGQGFLTELYKRIPGSWEEEQPLNGKHRRLNDAEGAQIRQVPGDGNCLFNAIAVSLCKVEQGQHCPFDDNDFQQLRQYAQALREKAVDFLEKRAKTIHRPLYLQGDTCIETQELLEHFSSQYGMSAQEYCDAMRQDGVWAGGPEIVALCNVMKRPIHLYELHVDDNDYQESSDRPRTAQFCLRRMCCFGSPRFDSKEAIHVLSADSRFPDINPGRHLREGNHFLSVFPATSSTLSRKPQRVRGGGGMPEVASELYLN
ncbi:cysteine protease [Fragilaria crotonensis]|nr:cysteine protease [Fragilaria crotonensis]